MRKLLLGLGLVALLLTAAPDAFAQTGGEAAENFTCTNGRASGDLYNSNPSCPTTLSFDHIFSYFICNMEQLSSNLMGNMYCGMVTSLTPMVMAVMSIAVMVFGFGFTIGIIPATAREFQKFLLKVGFIAVFATQSEFLIGYGYRFLVEGSREGITIALSGLYTAPSGSPSGNTGATMYAQLDGFLGQVLHFATDYVGAKWDGSSNPCQNAIFAVLAIMAVAFPPLFYLALLIVVKIAITFLRAVFGYVYSIVGIAFLLALAPFFLSFYMFGVTRSYFDKWLGYLISFSLQMVVVFAFLTFIVSIDVKSLSSSLVNIIVPVQETQETTSYRLPWKYCTLCEFEVVVRDADGSNERVLPDSEYQAYLGQGELRCKANPNYDSSATSGPNSKNYVPIRALSAVSPPPDETSATPAPDRTVQSALLKFASTALLSLLVLAYIIDGILRFVPYFAQKISGGLAPYAPQLGGGSSPSGVPTVDIPGVRYDAGSQRYEGVLGSFERGFNAGFTGSNSNSLSRTMSGLSQGFSSVRSGYTDPKTGQRDPSMSERFINYLTNPLGGSSRD